MPKTGSTAIQQSLYYDVRDPAVHYFGFGAPDAALPLACLFESEPRNRRLYRRLGYPLDHFADYRRRMLARLDAATETARRHHKHLVISSEYAFMASREFHERLHQYLQDRGFEVQLLAYFRPWKSHLESLFQQMIKAGRAEFEVVGPRERLIMNYRDNVERLWDVYGRERVSAIKFDRAQFPLQSIVQDFGRRIGLSISPTYQRSSNVGLKLSALRLMFTFNRWSGLVHGVDEPLPPRYWRISNRLRELPGASLRLHSELTRPFLEEWQEQLDWVERELGFSLAEDPAQHDHLDSLRTEEDLYRYDAQSLAWLARANGRAVVVGENGEALVRAVARHMDQLRHQWPTPTEVCQHFGLLIQQRWIHWRTGA
jgi:hypothetical protein